MRPRVRYLALRWLAGNGWPWATTAARAGLAVVWLFAGTRKIGDVDDFGRAINAYRILPYDMAMATGAALPLVEVMLGMLLLLGLATRVVAGVSAALLIVFMTGIVWVWAHGYRIDCGCFGSGGGLGVGESPTYLFDLVRDSTLLALAVLLLIRPGGWLAVDNWLHHETQIPSGEGNR